MGRGQGGRRQRYCSMRHLGVGSSRGKEPVFGGGNLTVPLGIFSILPCPYCVINVIGMSLSEPHISEYYGR